jgi:hypothetical protein
VAMTKFLSLKELHRPPSSPRRQTSAQARYLTANTNAAQRLRALALCRRAVAEPTIDWLRREPTFTVVHRNGVSWSTPVGSAGSVEGRLSHRESRQITGPLLATSYINPAPSPPSTTDLSSLSPP